MSKQLRNSRVRFTELGLDKSNLVPSYVLMSLLFYFDQVQKVFVVGDSAQLPPFGSKPNHEIESLFTATERAYRDIPGKVKFLETQFRMPSVIADELSLVSYGGQLKPAAPKERQAKDCLSWYDIRGTESAGRADGSKINVDEAQAIVGLVNWLQDDLNRTDIAVQTFYSAQQSMLATVFNKRQSPKNVNISTVDAFEGREAECVILRLVNTETAGFVDLRRANVGLSRGKEEMFIVGDRKFWAENAPENIGKLEKIATAFPLEDSGSDENSIVNEDDMPTADHLECEDLYGDRTERRAWP
jgi:superfamily I DNA and/or RNA helicase